MCFVLKKWMYYCRLVIIKILVDFGMRGTNDWLVSNPDFFLLLILRANG
jgi:hypothetical protein